MQEKLENQYLKKILLIVAEKINLNNKLYISWKLWPDIQILNGLSVEKPWKWVVKQASGTEG